MDDTYLKDIIKNGTLIITKKKSSINFIESINQNNMLEIIETEIKEFNSLVEKKDEIEDINSKIIKSISDILEGSTEKYIYNNRIIEKNN